MATPAQQMLLAVQSGDAEEVSRLLDADPCLCDVKDRSPSRWSALHHAVDRGHLDIVELLLVAGSAVDRQDSHGRAALHLAAWSGNLAMVELLVNANATVQIGDNDGYLPWDCQDREIGKFLRVRPGDRIKYGRPLERNGRPYGKWR